MSEQGKAVETEVGAPAPQSPDTGQQQPPPAGTDEEQREDYAGAREHEHPLESPETDAHQDDQA